MLYSRRQRKARAADRGNLIVRNAFAT